MGNFIQRITTQVNHVRHLVQTVFDVVSTQQIPKSEELTRDAFGLHTIIVVVTSSGKVKTKLKSIEFSRTNLRLSFAAFRYRQHLRQTTLCDQLTKFWRFQ